MRLFSRISLALTVFWPFACANQKPAHENIQEHRMTVVSQESTPVIYYSADGGKSWMPFADGIPQDATVSSFLVIDHLIFAATEHNGIYSIREGEKQWKQVDEDLPEGMDINAIAASGDSFVVGTSNHGVLISKNNGRNWSNPAIQIKNTSIRSLYVKGNSVFGGADNGIYRSPDNGNTWKQVWKGVQVNGFTEQNNKLYAAVRNGAMMTNDNGANWSYIYTPNTLHDISTDGESIYAMTLGSGLKKSANSGMIWEDVNDGLGTLNLYTFEVKRFNNTIFAAQWYGIYKSHDRGRNWSLIKEGLPDSTAFTTLETTRSGLIAGIGLRKR